MYSSLAEDQANGIFNFNIVCSVLGAFVTLFGLVSYLLKEGFYLTEALVALTTGALLSPYGLNIIRPLEYVGSEAAIATTTLCFTRLVLGIQLVIAGIQLPSKYLRTEWRSLFVLLGPAMMTTWIVASLIAWALVPGLTYVQALAIGACVTPTDPVLSNSIVKGRFANKHIPVPLQRLIIAESGANDGLGYIFLFLPLYLVTFAGANGSDGSETAHALTYWLGRTWLYTVLISVIYGAVVGLVAKEALHWADKKRLIDEESYLLFSVALALFIIGTVGLIDADDVLACFIAGNTFTWDDKFRQRTEHDSLQPIMDLLLNVVVFMWAGSVCPWDKFLNNDIISTNRLVVLGVLMLLFRRLPIVFALRWKIPQITRTWQAILTGFFGPIGISAIFYLYLSLDVLQSAKIGHSDPEGLTMLGEAIFITIWFLVIFSVFVHGLTIPITILLSYFPGVYKTVKFLGRLFRIKRHPRNPPNEGINDPERNPLLGETS